MSRCERGLFEKFDAGRIVVRRRGQINSHPTSNLSGEMGKIRRTFVNIEIDQVLLAKVSGLMQFRCDECGATVTMLTPEQAGIVTGLNARAIYRLIETGELHFTETPAGSLFVCCNSLPSYCRNP